jgi:23S rRNA (guanosine2251-2'-O)-methyltransferase
MIISEILYGYHPVMEAVNARRRRVFEVYTAEEGNIHRKSPIQLIVQKEGFSMKKMSRAALNKLAGSPFHQGIAARVSPFPVVDISDILKHPAGKGEEPFLLLVDNITDPQNLGALIRTGICAGIHGVIIPKDRSSPPTPAVSKASAGALEYANFARVSNMAACIKILKQSGIWVIGLDPAAENSLFSTDLTGSLAVVVGGEGKGIRPLVKKHCDDLVSIPNKGRVDSLNAAVAGGIAMYEALRQRQKMKSFHGKKE